MRKLKTCVGMLLNLGGLVLSSCGVLPNGGEEPSFDPLPDAEQDHLVNKIFDTKYLKADLDINVAHTYEVTVDDEKVNRTDNYHVTGSANVDIQSLDNVGADVSLSLDMNDKPESDLPKIDVNFVYVDNTFFLDINNRSAKLETDDLGELIDLLLGDGSKESEEEETEQTNIDNSGIKEIVTNIANMTVTNEGTYYKYVSQTTGDQPDLVITSDFDYNITSLSIMGIKYQDFKIDVKINTEVLSSLDKPISSPETSGHPYINLTNYYGVFRKLRRILDDEHFGMNYNLALTHYEPKTPDQKIYLGDTTGRLNMDLANSAVDLDGIINISDIRTDDHEAYSTPYHAQYIDESIYLDYTLKDSGNHHKLTLSNQGLGDLWDMMGDSEIFGINIFDLIFGASDKEYPIIDIITDSTWREITKYGAINLSNNYVEIDVDNYLLGGLGHGSIKINLNDDENRTIKNVTITSLDINSYIVNGRLEFDEYTEIVPVTADEYSSLDGIDDLVRSGASYFRSNKYNLGLKLDITDSDTSKTFSVVNEGEGDTHSNLQVNIHPKDELNPEQKTGYDGYADLTINDFDSNIHRLRLNANPKGGEENVYVDYSYKDHAADPEADPVELKLRATRTSISSLFDQLTGYSEETEEVDIFKMIEPYIAKATKDTLHRVLKEGDYFAILRDETMKVISMNDHMYTLVFDKASFGFTEDITINVKMKLVYEEEVEKEIIDYIQISTKYEQYVINAKVTLKDNNADIPELSDKTGYIPIDTLTDIFMNKSVRLDVTANVGKVINNAVEPYIQVRGNEVDTPCKIDAEIIDTGDENADLWDKLYARVEGSVFTSGGSEWTPFIIGYDDNLSIKFGDEAKVTVTRANVKNIIERAKTVLPETHVVPEVPVDEETQEPLDNEVEGNINMFLQVMQMLSEGNYADFLSKIKSTSLVDGGVSNPSTLVIKVDNSMFSDVEEGSSEATINITFNTAGISGIGLEDFRYSNYSLTGAIVLQDRDREPVNIDGYNQVYNIINAVLNTATEKDVVLSGAIRMNAKALGFDAMNRNFTYNAFVHKDTDINGNENVYGRFTFSDVPFLYVGPSQGFALYKVSDDKDEWDDGSRTFDIYFASTLEYDGNGHTVLDENKEPIRTTSIGLVTESYKGSTLKIKEKTLSSDDFMADLTYYLLNYGLGIKAIDRNYSTSYGDAFSQEYGEHKFSTDPDEGFINFHNYNIDNNYTPNLSTLLESYDYSAVGTTDTTKFPGGKYTSSIYSDMTATTDKECWLITIDGGNLLNNDQLKEVELFTNVGGTGEDIYLANAVITTKVTVSVATLSVGMTVNYNRTAVPTSTQVDAVKAYFDTHDVGYRRYKSGSTEYVHVPNA